MRDAERCIGRLEQTGNTKDAWFMFLHQDGSQVGPLPMSLFEQTVNQLLEVEKYKQRDLTEPPTSGNT